MKNKIFHNWGLKLISLLFASLLWILVVQMGDPPDEKDMGNIPVKLVNAELLERENKVYQVLDNSDTVRVTVYAPQSVFERLRSSDIVAEADVSRLTDINTVPIKFSSSVSNILSIEGNREVVKLDVEDKASKYVRLESNTVGEVAEGYIVMGVTPDQNRIEVSGPKSIVEQVKYAGAEIDVTDATGNLNANIDIQLYDADGNPLEHVNLHKNVDYVRLSVEVLAVKEIPVELNYTGNPADGYMATGEVDYEPKSVKVAGGVYVLQRINALVVPAEKLDITDQKSDLEQTIDIREFLPDNIKLADSNYTGRVEAKVHIEPIMERTLRIPEGSVSVKNNLPDGFTADIEEPEDKVYVLNVRGLARHVGAGTLRESSVLGTVDVAEWMKAQNMSELKPGTYHMPISFDLNERIVIDTPLQAKVVIRETEN